MSIQRFLSEKIGQERETIHRFDKSSRQLTKNTNSVGLRGEYAFGELSGLYPDVEAKHCGDNGIDFVAPLLFSIDVKTRIERPQGLKETFMLVEAEKSHSDIYVLAILSSDDINCECVGWMWKSEVLKYPVGDLGTGVKNHQVPALSLRPMQELINRIAKWNSKLLRNNAVKDTKPGNGKRETQEPSRNNWQSVAAGKSNVPPLS